MTKNPIYETKQSKIANRITNKRKMITLDDNIKENVIDNDNHRNNNLNRLCSCEGSRKCKGQVTVFMNEHKNFHRIYLES